MKVTEISDHCSFLALEKQWTEVLERCRHTVFSTWEWLTMWWKHFGSDRKHTLLLVENNGSIIGIAPLMYSVHKMLGLRQGKTEIIGTPDTDYDAREWGSCLTKLKSLVNS